MSNKFQARVANKNDIAENWSKAENFQPLKGEIIIYNTDEETLTPKMKIGDGVTKVNDLPFFRGDCIGEETEEGGILLHEVGTNQALAKNTLAAGEGSWAGYYGFKIKELSIGPSETQKLWLWVTLENTETTKAYEVYSEGDIVQIHLASHYHDRYKISEALMSDPEGLTTRLRLLPTYTNSPIDSSGLYTITDNLVLADEVLNYPDGSRNWLYVIGKPYGEPIKFSKDATALGYSTIATGTGALSTGVYTEALGLGSFTAGSGTRAGYTGLATGVDSEAMFNRSTAMGYGVKTGRVNQTAVGMYNEVEENAMFVVGGGTGDATSTRKTIFKVENNGDVYGKRDLRVEGEIQYKDVNLTEKMKDVDYQLASPDRYKIVDKLPDSSEVTNYSDMYLVKQNDGYSKYIYGDTNISNTEISNVWDGTLVEPIKNSKGQYVIDTAEKLAYAIYNGGTIGEETGCHFVITKDIYLNDIEKINWATGTITSGYSAKKWYSETTEAGQKVGAKFNGVIDGNYHTIHGIYIPYKWSYSPPNSSNNAAGFIPSTASGSNVVVKNLNIDNSFIKVRGHAGGIIGATYGKAKIENCSVGKNVALGGYSAAAIRGAGRSDYSFITIENCYSLSETLIVDSGGNLPTAYGLCGYFWDNSAEITSSFNATGPIVSTDYVKLRVKDCYSIVDEIGIEGITVLSQDNMQGLDVLTNPNKMPLLEKLHMFKATESYPTYKFATFGWIKIDDSVTKEYIDEALTCEKNTTSYNNFLVVNVPFDQVAKLHVFGYGSFDYEKEVIITDAENTIIKTIPLGAMKYYNSYFDIELKAPVTTIKVNLDIELTYYTTLKSEIERAHERLNNLPSVDQTYNPESENAQSGKAVAEGLANMVNSAPETLNTLNELAAALGNDANFAATVAEQIGKKADKTELENFVTEEQVEAQIALTNEEFLLDNSEKYKIVDELPMMLSEVNQSEMYLIKEDTGYNKYIYNELEEKITEASSIWDGTMIEPQRNSEGVYIIDSAEKLAYVVYNGGAMIIGTEIIATPEMTPEGDKIYVNKEVPVYDNNCTFLITKDIYLNDINKINWTTGTAVSGYTANKWYSNNTEAGQKANSAFSGTIDGGYHTIHGIYIPYKWSFSGVATDNGAAFIAAVTTGANATIKNLNIDNAFIKSRGHTGGIIGVSKGIVNIDSCTVGANVHLGGSSVGAIRGGGRSDNSVITVNNCYSLADLNLADSTGASTTIKGLFGYFWDKSININSCFNANGPICSSVYKTKIKDCYATEEVVALDNVVIIAAENMQGLDVLTNSEKMPLLNKHIFKPTESYPVYKFATFGLVKINDSVTKEYVNQITDEINNKINNIKGNITGTSIEINDISSISHYIKCQLEYDDLAKNLVLAPLPEGHEVYKGLEGPEGQPDVTIASIKHLDRNSYYYISVKFKDGVHGGVYVDSYSWTATGAPYYYGNNQVMPLLLTEDIDTLYISHAKPEDIISVSIIKVNDPNTKPADYNNIVITATSENGETKLYYADEHGLINTIESTYPSILITTDMSVNMTCEYVKESQFADIIGMIVPRYLAENI